MCILSFIAVCIYCIVDFFVDRSEQKTEKIEALIQELFGKKYIKTVSFFQRTVFYLFCLLSEMFCF